MLGYGSLIYYADPVTGKPQTPPAGQIENPNPVAGNEQLVHAGRIRQRKARCRGSYVNCADDSQPGVKPLKTYLRGPSLQGVQGW